jgi:hypothetical protein
MPSSDDVEEVGENGEDIQELAEDGKLYFTIGSTS